MDSKRTRVAVVLNGNAKSLNEAVRETIDSIIEAGDLFVSRSVDEVEEIAQTVLARGYSTVLIGGGDGTFTTVVSGILRQARLRKQPAPRFAMLRLGTGNALAWVVGASAPNDTGALLADIDRIRSDAGSRSLRLIESEGIFAPFCGLGMDAEILNDFTRFKSRLPFPRRWIGGFRAYAASVAVSSLPKQLVRAPRYVRIVNIGATAYRMSNDAPTDSYQTGEVIFEGTARLVSASTIPYYGFGFRVFPFADVDSTRMNLRISSIGALEFFRNTRAIWRGDYRNTQSLSDFLVEAVRVDVDPATQFHIGGEMIGQRSSLELALSPDSIELADFYLPPNGTRAPAESDEF